LCDSWLQEEENSNVLISNSYAMDQVQEINVTSPEESSIIPIIKEKIVMDGYDHKVNKIAPAPTN
jgi:hypothetical protein